MEQGNGLDENCQRDEIVGMRTGRAILLMAVLAVQPICVLGNGTVSPPNPVGEAVYRPHLLHDMLPLAVIVCAVLLGLLLHAIQRKIKRLSPDNIGSHHI